MSLSAGQTLSCYEILGSLGAGAMGEVYRARDTRLEREVAIKVLPGHFIEDEERLLFFRDGRQVLAVDVETEGPFDAGRPRLLFSGDYASQGASGLADYDVSLDGARFVMVSERLGRRGATVNVVLNWFDELASGGSKE